MSETIFQDITLNSVFLDNNGNDYLVGEIIMWPNATNIPYNCLNCDGSLLNKTTYSDLFDIIGIKYGEQDNKFKLPNLNNSGLDDSNSLLIKGITNMSGTSSVSSFQFYDNTNYGNNLININQIPSHDHNITNNKNVIEYNINLQNKNSFYDGGEIKSANVTGIQDRHEDSGGANPSGAPDRNHTHNIGRNNTPNAKLSVSSINLQDSVNIDYNISLDNNIASQVNYKPTHVKVNYLICYTK